ncbi:hypothetical protein TOPH_00536 [Tolypocladium ophioglossoides CBS 100239]|uniref:Uncharacterized protein n=1 Tax=Tolypocladium ophioglossoides (strain CBS 100239) TaxID=1163406 RepID=A0A0L0NL67_TOLOC|nr:hypothetical protein TOPH_00536 [Tolypocladium ophioglossoides CBS 100239]
MKSSADHVGQDTVQERAWCPSPGDQPTAAGPPHASHASGLPQRTDSSYGLHTRTLDSVPTAAQARWRAHRCDVLYGVITDYVLVLRTQNVPLVSSSEAGLTPVQPTTPW